MDLTQAPAAPENPGPIQKGKGKPRSGDRAWSQEQLQRFPSIFKVEGEGLYCVECQAARKGGVWDTLPFKTVRISLVEKHLASEEHCAAVQARLEAHKQPRIFGALNPADKDAALFESWKAKFAAIYWLCQNEVSPVSVVHPAVTSVAFPSAICEGCQRQVASVT